MSQVNSSTNIIVCHLWIEELLQYNDLRNGGVCVGCAAIIGAHARRPGMSSFIFFRLYTVFY